MSSQFWADRATLLAARLNPTQREATTIRTLQGYGWRRAEGGVLVDLGEHHVGQDFARTGGGPLDHRRRSLVAGGLDAEHNHAGAVRL